MARLALTGALTLAQLVDLVTRSQLRRHLGALPVLYALLEVLQVREIINRHCPTAAEVDHGAVAMVLILNRLMAPQPLYQVADWLARTVLVYRLGVPAEKFNDDRLGRTLDAISQHKRDIWQDIVHRAFVQAGIDLTLIFYDLTAFVVHGAYTDSQLADDGEKQLAALYQRYCAAPAPQEGEKATMWYRTRLLVLHLWNNWSRLTLYQRWQGPDGERLDGTNNACERAIGWGVKERYRSMRGYKRQESVLNVSSLLGWLGQQSAGYDLNQLVAA